MELTLTDFVLAIDVQGGSTVFLNLRLISELGQFGREADLHANFVRIRITDLAAVEI